MSTAGIASPEAFWPARVVAGTILASLTFYALAGGADFGGGVWDLFARGPRAERQRRTIAHAIGPIWEANHVWLIVAIVLLFACFPLAFAAIGTALHIPLTAMLIGIVLRGSAFAFRSYGEESDRMQARWSRVFAVASTVTPVMLGVTMGAVASGEVRIDPATGQVTTDFVSAWLAPFPFCVGLLTLALFAALAAVYLTLEASDPELRDDFRRRGVAAAVVAGVLALAGLWLASRGAPLVFRGLTGRPWSWALLGLTAVAWVGSLGALAMRRFALARACVALLVALVVWGWALAQYPYLLPPDLTIDAAAAPVAVLRLTLIGLGVGALVLAPSLVYLFRVFHVGARAAEPGAE